MTSIRSNDEAVVASEDSEPHASVGSRLGSTPVRIVERYGLLLLTAVVIAVFSLLPSSADLFLTTRNIQYILSDQTVITIAALAVVVPLLAGQFDVSCGSVIGITCIATASAMSRFELGLPIAIVVAVALGAFIGCVNGVLVAYLRLNAIIVTLAMTIIISGVVDWYTEGVSITTGISPTLTGFGSGTWWGVPRPALLLVLVCVLVAYLLDHTPFGRHLHMIGENPQAARLIGVRVQRETFRALVLGGALSGVAGVALCARIAGANPQDGPSYLFPALVAAFLGTTAIRPGAFSVGGTLLAVFFVAVTVSGLSLSGADPWVQPVFNGSALLIAVGLSQLLSFRRERARA